VSRLPIRARLTAAFALALVAVLAGAAALVYVRLKADLDEQVDTGLRSRAAAIATGVGDAGSASAGTDPGVESEESFARILAPDGRALDEAGGARGPALSPSELRRARKAPIIVDRRVEGIEGKARVLAQPLPGRGGAVSVVGHSLGDRDETLSTLLTSFAVGGALALLLASAIGYALATAALGPMEAMRRRASELSLADDQDRLPLPAARDEVRRLGETLNEMLDRLRRSFERERRFVADASHELRTPVAVVKTELEGALRAGGHRAEVREALTAAVEECDHIAQLAEDLLILARAGDGRLPVSAERFEARRLLEGVATRFSDRAAARGRTIELESPEGLFLHVDSLRLRQALGNLLDNALRHGEGPIALRVRPVGAWIELDVSDGGTGFTPAFAERAFERFARDAEGRTRDAEAAARGGAGLGLSIVRAIAEAHGGTAEIVSGPATTVRIRIPEPSQAGLSGDPDSGSRQRATTRGTKS